jgi:hypothetical protein
MPDGIEYRPNARINLLKGNPENLDSIAVDENGNTTVIPCSGLFLCPEPVMEWRVLGRIFANADPSEFERFILAGVAAGLPFNLQPALYRSGVDAGISLLEKTRTGS